MQTKKNTTLIFIALGLLFLGATAVNLTPQPITTTEGNNIKDNNQKPTTNQLNPAPAPAAAPASKPADANKPPKNTKKANAKKMSKNAKKAKDLGTVCTRDLKVVKKQKLLVGKQVFSYEEGTFEGKVRKVVILADSANISNTCQKRSVYPKDIKTTKNKLRNRFNIFGVKVLNLNGKFIPAITSYMRGFSIAAAMKAKKRQFEPKHFDGDEKFKAIAANSRFEFERFRDYQGNMQNFLVLVPK